MGANVQVDEVEPPVGLLYLWELHKSMRFSSILKDGEIALFPRQQLSFRELSSYLGCRSLSLNSQEIDVIMSIDSTYERFSSGNF